MGWCYVCVCCESGLFVEMAGPGICVLCSVDICTSYVHPVFNHVAPYLYLLTHTYLSVADIANPDFQTFLCVVFGPGLVSTSPSLMMSSSRSIHQVHMAGLPKKNTVSRAPIAGGSGEATQFAQPINRPLRQIQRVYTVFFGANCFVIRSYSVG